MSSGAIIAIAIAVLVVLAVLVFVSAARRHDGQAAGALSRETRRRDRRGRASAGEHDEAGLTGRAFEETALAERSKELVPVVEAPPPVAYSPPDADTVGYTRRQFFNRSIVAMMGVSLASFGGAMLAFLYPRKGGGFGSTVTIGKLDDIIKLIRDSKGFYYVPDARTWVTAYPAESLPKAAQAYGKQAPVLAGMKAGIVALYQKCPHLGCRVPQCETSQWFECPCHGSQYNRVGEKKGGPAPRGMDRFGVTVTNGLVSVDTSNVFIGPPIGTNTTGQEAEGPHCIASAGGHA
jgi:cytochrome b6-f complex iron-sulfur subunit